MKTTIKFFVCATIIALLQGCASLSKEECLVADWQQIGFEDGSRGRDLLTLARHRKACAKAGITPDRAAYERGHRQGLLRYCNYQTGLSLGERGSSKPTFCPAESLAQFDRGYAHGIERFQQQQLIGDIQSDIQSLETRIADYQDSLDHYEAVIISDDSSSEERAIALEEIRDKELELKLLESELIAAQNALSFEQQNLQRLIDSQH